MKALMKKLILTALAFMAGALSVTYAINPVRIDTVRTQLVVPRPALEPLKSLVTSPTDAIDTLDTANEHIKVVLHADNTWHYYKTPSFQQVSGLKYTIDTSVKHSVTLDAVNICPLTRKD